MTFTERRLASPTKRRAISNQIARDCSLVVVALEFCFAVDFIRKTNQLGIRGEFYALVAFLFYLSERI